MAGTYEVVVGLNFEHDGKDIRYEPGDFAPSGTRPEIPSGSVSWLVAQGAIREPGGGEPWDGYDDETVDEIVAQLDGLSGDDLQAVKEYEAANKGRVTILNYEQGGE